MKPSIDMGFGKSKLLYGLYKKDENCQIKDRKLGIMNEK